MFQDHADTAKLLAKENVDREALMLYAREAAEFSTEYQMIGMEFAVNHYGQPDVAMFDFTSMYAAENASRILERRGHKLLMILVGDSLLEVLYLSLKFHSHISFFHAVIEIVTAVLADGIRLRERISKLVGRLLGDQRVGRERVAVGSDRRAGVDLQAARPDYA